MKEKPKMMLTVGEASRMLHIAPNTIRRWSNIGKLKAYRVGARGDRRFKPEDIASLMQAEAIEAKPIKKANKVQPLVVLPVEPALTESELLAEEFFSPRQLSVIALISDGNSNKRIAHKLGISEQTVKNHMTTILKKTRANDRAHVVAICFRNGVLKVPATEIINKESIDGLNTVR